MSSSKSSSSSASSTTQSSSFSRRGESKDQRKRRICTDLNRSTCSLVSDKDQNWFEARSACIYQYLSRNMSDVYSIYMTVPILLSFLPDDQLKQEILDNAYRVFLIPDPPLKTKAEEKAHDAFVAEMTDLGDTLIFCNQQWNDNFSGGFLTQIRRTIDIHQILENPEYKETLLNTKFLQEILGVINKKEYVEESDKYLGQDKLKDIDEKIDDKCKVLDETLCVLDQECMVRTTSKGDKQCINRQRSRKIDPTDPESYYIYGSDTYTIFKPLSKSFIVSGYTGIFQQYAENNRKKFGPTNKYTIVFPPFDDLTISGINAFYVNGYIAQYQTNTGNTVGIHTGLYSYIEEWYTKQFLPLGIRQNADIYIVGTSLGGALTNIAAYFLVNNGYTSVHFYAHGSPRVGDLNFKNYMDSAPFENDSCNYIRFNNAIGKNAFSTEFDPVCTFPPNQMCFHRMLSGRCLDFVNNSRLRGFSAGMTFDVSLLGFDKQPDYDMNSFTVYGRLYQPPILHNSSSYLWDYIHSVTAYSANSLNGEDISDGPGYLDHFDAIRNIDEVPKRPSSTKST